MVRMSRRIVDTSEKAEIVANSGFPAAKRPLVRVSPYILTLIVLWTILAGVLLMFRAGQTEDRLFTGIIGSRLNAWVADDSAFYLNMIYQAQHGAWLFQNEFTSEVSEPRFLNSIWLIVGKTTSPLGISPVGAFTIFRFAAILCFVMALRRFLLETVRRSAARKLALFLITFCGGVGWVFYALGHNHEGLAMLYMEGRKSEPTQFLPILISPHLIFATALMLWIFAGFVASSRGSKRAAWTTPALVFFIATFHPYEVVVIGAVGAVFIVLTTLRDHKLSPMLLRTYLLSMLFAAPVVVYHWCAIRNVADLQGFNVWKDRQPASVIHYIVAVLPLGVLAGNQLFSRLSGFRQVSYGQLLNAAWALSLPIMIYSYPTVPFARKLAIGMSIPVYVMAAEWIERRFRGSGLITRRGAILWRSRRAWIVTLAVGTMLCGNLLTLLVMVKDARERSGPFYMSEDTVDAMRWLALQPGRDEVVLSTVDNGRFVPNIAHKRAFLGHRLQTVDYQAKEEFARSLFSDGKLTKKQLWELNRYRVKWVFYGRDERRFWSEMKPSEHFRLVCSRGKVRIFRVEYGETKPGPSKNSLMGNITSVRSRGQIQEVGFSQETDGCSGAPALVDDSLVVALLSPPRERYIPLHGGFGVESAGLGPWGYGTLPRYDKPGTARRCAL